MRFDIFIFEKPKINPKEIPKYIKNMPILLKLKITLIKDRFIDGLLALLIFVAVKPAFVSEKSLFSNAKINAPKHTS